MSDALEDARRVIDDADRRIVRALKDRFDAVSVIGDYKIENGLPAYDPARHEAVLRRAEDAMRETGGDPAFARRVFEAIAGYCLEAQEIKMRRKQAQKQPRSLRRNDI